MSPTHPSWYNCINTIRLIIQTLKFHSDSCSHISAVDVVNGELHAPLAYTLVEYTLHRKVYGSHSCCGHGALLPVTNTLLHIPVSVDPSDEND
jgi:hypothetical protein